ncbi:hypothetical protein METHB2_520010 [Candidatus Methylobacter favarea]|uniref:Uncharacterized protein n=1 Tax=Candidatus Methylobacter favarea TaxID=2707345 RepID=A0A8S0WBT0_9GAMM|nr:hypothetical protein [Candidatus Methylobacter favarea]CAA9891903.1 hypothetical protein METHB2_520010 [Candidatus Methylobacter favarea]
MEKQLWKAATSCEKILPYTVDLRQYAELANIGLSAHIDRVGVVIYDRNTETNKANAENSARVRL